MQPSPHPSDAMNREGAHRIVDLKRKFEFHSEKKQEATDATNRQCGKRAYIPAVCCDRHLGDLYTDSGQTLEARSRL